MSEVLVRRRHRLGLARATELAEQMAGRLRDDFGGSYAWDGKVLRFERPGASGHVAVTPSSVEIRVDIGWLLGPLRSRIEREIAAFCDRHLGAPAASPSGRSTSGRGDTTTPGRVRRAPGTGGRQGSKSA